MDIIRAKEIISALAEGVDPTTGEVLPDNCVCNKGEVVRALYALLAACPSEKTVNKSSSKDLIAFDVDLYERLRAARNKLATEKGIPPYRVIPNTPLMHIAAQLPTTEDELLQVHGIGKYTAKKYGSIFIAEIKNHLKK